MTVGILSDRSNDRSSRFPFHFRRLFSIARCTAMSQNGTKKDMKIDEESRSQFGVWIEH